MDVPIMVHPHNPAASDRLEHYALSLILGLPFDTTMAIASIVFGGVLKTFPKLRFYFVHGGGFVPYQQGRFEHGFKVRAETREKIDHPPSYYLKKVWYDGLTHSKEAFEYLVKVRGASGVLMGSDYPFDIGDKNPLASIKRSNISSEDKHRVAFTNAARLFRI
jgi:aminocarboxymuconate-semialdehyde decarboxylase